MFHLLCRVCIVMINGKNIFLNCFALVKFGITVISSMTFVELSIKFNYMCLEFEIIANFTILHNLLL